MDDLLAFVSLLNSVRHRSHDYLFFQSTTDSCVVSLHLCRTASHGIARMIEGQRILRYAFRRFGSP